MQGREEKIKRLGMEHLKQTDHLEDIYLDGMTILKGS